MWSSWVYVPAPPLVWRHSDRQGLGPDLGAVLGLPGGSPGAGEEQTAGPRAQARLEGQEARHLQDRVL